MKALMASSSNKPPPSTAPSSTARTINTQNSYYPTQTPANAVAGPSSVGSQSYYDSTGSTAWQSAWTMAAYPYSSQTITPYPQQQYTYTHFQPQVAATNVHRKTEEKPAIKQKSPSPSPPPPEPCKYWDKAIKKFLERVGLVQALRGLELDIVVMNSEWEERKVPDALKDLMKDIQDLLKHEEEDDANQSEKLPLETRKLDYVHLANGAEARTSTSINKSIATFLAEKRANNDASNRAEFLCFTASQQGDHSSEISSCARTDAKEINRSAQIKYDIAKNEDGPLRRTMRSRAKSSTSNTVPAVTSSSTTKGKSKANFSKKGTTEKPGHLEADDLSSDLHPGLDERLTNVENHLAIRYVPSPPQSLLERLRFLEEHIIRLEKDYPPWAALHFNQPNRGWPPPPKATPIIVPPHLTRQTVKEPAEQQSATPNAGAGSSNAPSKGRKDTSLHRAVMERLEVQNAKSDLGSNR